MEFRPCIDIHNGKVKQIVGGSLLDEGNRAKENFVAEAGCGFFCEVVPGTGIKRRTYHSFKSGGFRVL